MQSERWLRETATSKEGTIMKAHTSTVTTSLIAVAVALLFNATPAHADFARDVALVQQGELSLEDAVQKAIAAGEDPIAIVVAATGVGLDVVRLASALMRAGVDSRSVRAAMLNAGVDPGAVSGAVAIAQAQFAAAAAASVTGPVSGPIVGATGAGAGAGG